MTIAIREGTNQFDMTFQTSVYFSLKLGVEIVKIIKLLMGLVNKYRILNIGSTLTYICILWKHPFHINVSRVITVPQIAT